MWNYFHCTLCYASIEADLHHNANYTKLLTESPPKIWMSYVHMILYKGMNIATESLNFRTSLKINLLHCKIFRIKSQVWISYAGLFRYQKEFSKVTKNPLWEYYHGAYKGKFKKFKKKITRVKNIYHIPKKKEHYKPAVFCRYNCTYIVTDPTGSIKKELHEPISKHTLIFNINNQLRLNLTFPFIYIIFKHLHDCPIGKLHIVSAGQNYTFCGIYSNMVNYPPGNSVNIYVNTFIRNATVLYKLFHTVFDIHKIKSLAIPNNVRQNILWIINFEIRKISVLKFHLLTTKLNYLYIIMTGKLINSVFVYDGPDEKSLRIKSTAGMYLASTFQCILHIYLANTEDYSILVNDMKYLSIIKPINRIVYLPRNVPQNILLNPSQGNYILLHFFTDEIYFINMTTIKLLYDGFNDPICTYAGITVINHFDKSDEQISTECFSYDGFYNYQNMYSRSNEVYLVFLLLQRIWLLQCNSYSIHN